MQKFIVRPVTVDDIAELECLNYENDFDIGDANMLLYFNLSPKWWYVITNEENKVVAYDSYNLLSNGLFYHYQLLVHQNYRGKKLTRMLKTMDQFEFPVISNLTTDSISRYKTKVFQWKLLQYYGQFNRAMLRDFKRSPGTQTFRITSLTVEKEERQQLFEKILNYDHDIIKLDRSDFLKEWLTPSDSSLSVVRVAIKNDQIIGYGVLRRLSDFYMISPCYADDHSTAEALIVNLLESFNSNETVNMFFPVPAWNSQSIRLSTHLKLELLRAELRHCTQDCTQYLALIDYSKVSLVHEYYPV